MTKRFAVIGCGRAGMAFAYRLTAAGYTPAGFASRSMESARRVGRISGFSGKITNKPDDAVAEAGIVLITTPDAAIRQTAQELARTGSFRRECAAFHASGALSSSELSALAEKGVSTGSIHPLQSFPAGIPEKNPFEGIMIGIEGDQQAIETARQVAIDLGGTPFSIETEGKMRYHAAAVVASNYLVTLMKTALDLLQASGVPSESRFAVLKPLIGGTLSNIENAGTVDALTGPIVRGDTDIVRAHVAAIETHNPEMVSLYKMMGRHTVDIAFGRHSISDNVRRELIDILSD